MFVYNVFLIAMYGLVVAIHFFLPIVEKAKMVLFTHGSNQTSQFSPLRDQILKFELRNHVFYCDRPKLRNIG